MEPRSIERGKILEQRDFVTKQHASMEPRSIERGKAFDTLGADYATIASMEPRSIERGKIRFAKSSDKPRCSFNGAAIN